MDFRDVYYRDPDLFHKQATVDRLIDDLAFTLDIERDDLNVVSIYPALGFFNTDLYSFLQNRLLDLKVLSLGL